MLVVIVMTLSNVWRKGYAGNQEMPPLVTGFGADFGNINKIWANYW